MSERTHSPRSILLGSLIVLGLAAAPGCYGEQLPPPAFRFSCDSAADCEDGEVCKDGLCQVACTFNTFEEDCPSGVGYAACFNGVCSHLCDPDEGGCSAPQTCVSFDLGDVGGGGGGGFGGAPTEIPSGICGVPCTGPTDCPAGELCLEGACIGFPDDTGGSDTGGTDGGSDTGGTATATGDGDTGTGGTGS